MARIDQELIDYALRSWRALNEVIESMSTEELQEALGAERSKFGRRRRSFLTRLTAKIYQVERKGAIKDLNLGMITPKNRRRRNEVAEKR